MNPVECYTSGCIPSSCRTAWGRMEKLHRLWRSLRKTSRESKLEKTDAFWELELNVSFQQASKGSVTDQLLWLAQSFTSVSSEVKKMLKIREYFLAYGLGQSSNSRSVFAFIRSSTSLFFTQILFVVTNDIQKKLGKKKRSRSLSAKWLRELAECQRNCSRKLRCHSASEVFIIFSLWIPVDTVSSRLSIISSVFNEIIAAYQELFAG